MQRFCFVLKVLTYWQNKRNDNSVMSFKFRSNDFGNHKLVHERRRHRGLEIRDTSPERPYAYARDDVDIADDWKPPERLTTIVSQRASTNSKSVPYPLCCFVCRKIFKRQRRSSRGNDVTKRREPWSEQETLKPKKEVETGYFVKPSVRRYDYTLSMIRKMSFPVLQKQNFDRHTPLNREGFFIKNKLQQVLGLDVIVEEAEAEDETKRDSLEIVNYVLQVRLDELITMPCRPIDGYDEAIIILAREHSADVVQKRTERIGLQGSTSSLSSIPSKITNFKDNRPNSTRSLLAMEPSLLLALLPTFSEQIHREVTHDFEYILMYSKYLESAFANELENKRHRRKKTTFSSERWLAVIYIDYRGHKAIESFRRLLIKLILLRYLIAFEEKDLSREDVLDEFDRRLGSYSPDHDVPFVFTNGVPIGGCSMMYYLYKIGLMDKIFKYSIMDPEQYHRWLHNPIENIVRDPLVLKVPLASFPLVQGIMMGTLIELEGSTISQQMEAFLVEGAFVVNQAQRKWNDIVRETKNAEPPLVPYVQLKMTIDNVLYMMEVALDRCRKRRSRVCSLCCGVTGS